MSESDNNIDKDGILFNEPITLCDLLKDGIKFEVNADFGGNEYLSDSDDEDKDDYNFLKRNTDVMLSPWNKSFDELRENMIKINNGIYKKIIVPGDMNSGYVPFKSKVVVEYSGFWENETIPFDSTSLHHKSKKLTCGKNQIITGIELCMYTMLKGEKSEFLIPYQLLYGKVGCPPRIKPKADGLFVIEIVDFFHWGIKTNKLDDNENDKDCYKFSVLKEEITSTHLMGVSAFKLGKKQNAVKLFHQAVNKLELCNVENMNEQNEQKKLLIKLYTNLAVCYNSLNLPKKVCLMCKELRNLTDVNKSCKILFQEGRALLAIGEYLRARNLLVKAQALEPLNEVIIKEIYLLDKKYSDYKKFEKEVCEKAFKIVQNKNRKSDNETSKNKDIGETFEHEIKKLIVNFKNNDLKYLTFAQHFSEKEVEVCKKIANDLNIDFTVTKVNNQHFFNFRKK